MPTIIIVFSEQAAEGLRQKWIRNIMGICNSPLRGKSALILYVLCKNFALRGCFEYKNFANRYLLLLLARESMNYHTAHPANGLALDYDKDYFKIYVGDIGLWK